MSRGHLHLLAGGAVLMATLLATADISPTTRPAMSEKTPTTQPTTQPACGIDDRAACGTAHWAGKSDAEWRKLLTPEQYEIARNAGTERAFTGKYWNTKTQGVYHCAACNQPLFASATKFDSGTGWPSFFKPVNEKAVTTHTDSAHGMTRTEIRCSQCASHLGHVFEDGPPPTGLRYCLNSAVLSLVPEKQEEKK